jgi:hypothetical protein
LFYEKRYDAFGQTAGDSNWRVDFLAKAMTAM